MLKKTKYLDNGTEVSVLAETAAGYIVQAVLEGSDGECYDGDVFYAKRVYDAPITERLAQSVREYDTLLSSKRAEVRKLSAEIEALKNQSRIDREKLKSSPDLSQLEAWLEGKLTHLVLINYSHFEIKTIDEALKSTSDVEDRGSVRLLSLYGGRTGPGGSHRADKFEWRLSAYSDGSGTSTRCLLATSEDDARRRIAEYVKPRLDEPYGPESTKVSLARSALRLGIDIDIPCHIKALIDKQAADAAALARKQAQADLDCARAHIERATAKAAKLGLV